MAESSHSSVAPELTATLLAIVASFAVPIGIIRFVHPYVFDTPGLFAYALFMLMQPLIVFGSAGLVTLLFRLPPLDEEVSIQPDGFRATYAPRGDLGVPLNGAALGASFVWVWFALFAPLPLDPMLTGLPFVGAAAFSLAVILGVTVWAMRVATRLSERRSTVELTGSVLRTPTEQLVLREEFAVDVSERHLTVTSGDDSVRIPMPRPAAEAVAEQLRTTSPARGDETSVPRPLRDLQST